MSVHAEVQAQAGFGMEGNQRPDGEFGESGADPSASRSEALLGSRSSAPPSISSEPAAFRGRIHPSER